MEQGDTEVKYLEATIEKAGDVYTAVASTNTTDRHGEVVDNNGWDLKAFKKNPVILWGHDHSEPAIGVSKKTWIEGTGKKAQLMIQPVFHDITEKARAVKALVDQGVIKSLSVGFRPLESPDGVTFTKNELLEVSMVNVPANADAMMMAYKSLKSEGFDDDVIEDMGIKAVDENAMRQSLQGMKETMTQMQNHMNDMMGNIDMPKALEELQIKIDELEKLVKVQPHQSKKQSEERLSMLKVIAKAADKVLEAENKRAKVDRRKLVKVIKRATEIITVAEKENLHG